MAVGVACGDVKCLVFWLSSLSLSLLILVETSCKQKSKDNSAQLKTHFVGNVPAHARHKHKTRSLPSIPPLHKLLPHHLGRRLRHVQAPRQIHIQRPLGLTLRIVDRVAHSAHASAVDQAAQREGDLRSGCFEDGCGLGRGGDVAGVVCEVSGE